MSDAAANVQSAAIADLETALGRFAQASLERITLAETAIRRTVEQLESRGSELRLELRQLEDEITNAKEDEDTSWTRHRREEAEVALAKVRHWQRNIDASVERYRRESHRLEELSTDKTVEARAYLRSLREDLAAYFALQKDGSNGFVGIRGDSIDTHTTTEAGPNVFDPTVFVLPLGHQWVRIDAIDTVRELADVQSREAFEKVSYDEMRRGFDMLRREILPEISDPSKGANSDTFASRDLADGVTYSQGLQRVFDSFFGTDAIHLSRGRDAKLFSVTGGRHRIKVAMDAGWTAVPVRLTDLSKT